MKKSLSIIAAVLLIGATLAWGDVPLVVENPSFELPGLGNYTGWDGEFPDTANVPGWTSDSSPMGSGVQSDMPASDGDWVGLLLGSDPSVWQITENVIVANEIFRLKVDGATIMGAPALQITLFAYDEIVDPNDPSIITPVRIPLATQEVALTAEMQTFGLEYSVAPDSNEIGLNLGIELLNTDKTWSVAAVDNVVLRAVVPTGIDIIWVTEEFDRDNDGVQDDAGWIPWLEEEGHTIDYRPGNWTSLDPMDPNDPNEVTKLDELNASDLIIVSRTTGSANYAGDGKEDMWNSVQTPIILMNSYLARESRWKWMNTSSVTADAASALEVLAADHPLFDGIELTQLNYVDPSDLIDPNDPNAPVVLPDPIYGIEAYDTTVGSGLTSFMGGLDVGSGELLAVTYETALGAVAEWKSGFEYYDGAGQVSGDHRILLAAGTLDADWTPQGAWNLTTEGAKILRNAIARSVAQPYMAREFQPVSGATGVALNGTLSWRPGQMATMYAIYLSSSENAVANGTALIDVIEGTSFDLAPLKLDLGRTYYWRIDATDGQQTWPGEIQSFKTIDYIVVDDFESYSSASIGNTWRDYWLHDGVARGASIIPDVDTTVVLSGSQSMALSFNNATNPYYFDAYRKWSGADWTRAGARYLVINFYGDPGNHRNDNLWVKINGIRVNYNGNGMRKAGWTQWVINLGSLPTPQWKIEKFDICVGDPPAPSGSQGIFYVDDIRLYRVAP